MKKIKVFMIVLTAVGVMTTSFAQKIKVKSGEISAIKGQTSINIEYDYEGMAVGKFETQEDYVEKKMTEYDEKEPGKGQKFKDSWYLAQKERFPNKFEQLMNDGFEKLGIKVSQNNTEAKYTFIVKTTFTEPGFNVGVMRRPAFTNIILKIVETTNKDNVVCEISSDANPGQDFAGFDFDASYRIAESYAKCAKSLAKVMSKQLK